MNMLPVIEPKSDQINADDLIAGPRTVTIRAVRVIPGAEQPVEISMDGTSKYFRPCKTVSRILVKAWGADANAYVGHSMTLYRDPDVTWGGMKVGGIRVSHLSGIDRELSLALSENKKSRKVHKIKPLAPANQGAATAEDAAANWTSRVIAAIETIGTADELHRFAREREGRLSELETKRPELAERVRDALAARLAALTDDEPFAADPAPDAKEPTA